MVVRVGAAVVALALVFAGASEASAASKRTKARRAFRQAQKLFKQERYEAALPLYHKAYELSDRRPSAIFGLAQCERLLDRYDDSIEHFLEYLAAKPGAKNADQVRRTIALLQEARTKAENKGNDADVVEVSGDNASPPATDQESIVASGTEGSRPPPAAGAASLSSPPESIVGQAPPPAEDSGSFWTSPVFFIVLGAVAAAGTAVALGFALSGEGEPYPGNTGVVLNNLEARP